MGANGTSWYLRGFLGGRRCREVGLLGLVHLKPCRPGLLVSSVPAPGEAGGFQAGSPSLSLPLTLTLCISLPLSLMQGFVLAVTIIREAVEEIRCYMRDKEVNSQVYSRLTARGQPPAAQPQGVAGGVGIGSQLGHGPLTVREQSSQPRAVGCGRLGRDSCSVAERLREARVCPGPGGTLATSLGHHCAPGARADG